MQKLSSMRKFHTDPRKPTTTPRSKQDSVRRYVDVCCWMVEAGRLAPGPQPTDGTRAARSPSREFGTSRFEAASTERYYGTAVPGEPGLTLEHGTNRRPHGPDNLRWR